jgi:disulfide bond formation protein DsbB
MISSASVINFLSALTLAGGILAITLLIIISLKPGSKLANWIEKNALTLMFIVAVTATCGSLFLSEIAGLTPCKFCWLQRIFMYPQTILLGIALLKKDRKISTYILALCVIGIIFSADQYIEQVNLAFNPGNAAPACDATGVSCAATEINFAFGYITIPIMALTAFVLNALGSIFVIRRKPRA